MWGGRPFLRRLSGRAVGWCLTLPRCSLKAGPCTTAKVSNDLHCASKDDAAGPFREERNFMGKTSAGAVAVDPAIGSLLGVRTSRGLTGGALSGNRRWRSPSGDVRDGWPSPANVMSSTSRFGFLSGGATAGTLIQLSLYKLLGFDIGRGSTLLAEDFIAKCVDKKAVATTKSLLSRRKASLLEDCRCSCRRIPSSRWCRHVCSGRICRCRMANWSGFLHSCHQWPWYWYTRF